MDEDKKKKKKPWWEEDSPFDYFEGLDEFIKRFTEEIIDFSKLNELIENIFKEYPFKFDESSLIGRREPIFWGFSLTRGPDNKPVIREFGNVKPSKKGVEIKEGREPLVDIISEGDKIVVVAELPGVEKQDIKLNATEDTLIISAETPQRKYYKEVEFKEKVDPKTSKAIYKNGVLEVSFEKLKSSKGSEISIQ
ncbi:MAG: archaeal heat shock protein Hsp20 [Candidatus Odinarchaeia archaeon]